MEQTLRFRRWRNPQLGLQNSAAAIVMGYQPISLAKAGKTEHERPMETLAAGLTRKGAATDLCRASMIAAFNIAIHHVVKHVEVKFAQSFAFLGAPVGIPLFRQVVALVDPPSQNRQAQLLFARGAQAIGLR